MPGAGFQKWIGLIELSHQALRWDGPPRLGKGVGRRACPAIAGDALISNAVIAGQRAGWRAQRDVEMVGHVNNATVLGAHDVAAPLGGAWEVI